MENERGDLAFSILNLAYAQNKKERAQRSLLEYGKGISPPFTFCVDISLSANASVDLTEL